MWGLTIYLMHLADYLHGRKYKMKCRSCGRVFKNSNGIPVRILSASPFLY
jgi:hypothetical protein